MLSDFMASKVLKIMTRQSSKEVFGIEYPHEDPYSHVITYTYDTNIYLGLCLSTSAPVVADTGTTIATKEPTAAEYKRVVVGKVGTSIRYLLTPNEGSTENDKIIYFPEALSSWGECSYYFFADAETGGNVLAFGALTTPIVPVLGKVPLVDVANMVLSFSGLSDDFAEDILAIFSSDSATIIKETDTVYIGLCTSAPLKTENGTDIAAKEPTNGYERVSLQYSPLSLSPILEAVTFGDTENSQTVFFPIVRTGGWGTISHFIITDSKTGGKIMAFGSLTPFTPAVDSVPLIRTAELTITFNE